MKASIAGRGALGEYFANTCTRPSRWVGWGGRYVRVRDGCGTVFDLLTTEADHAEVFGVVEWALPLPAGMSRDYTARLLIGNHVPAPGTNDSKMLRFRFSPATRRYGHVMQSDLPALNGRAANSLPWRLRRSAPGNLPPYIQLVDRRPGSRSR